MHRRKIFSRRIGTTTTRAHLTAFVWHRNIIITLADVHGECANIFLGTVYTASTYNILRYNTSEARRNIEKKKFSFRGRRVRGIILDKVSSRKKKIFYAAVIAVPYHWLRITQRKAETNEKENYVEKEIQINKSEKI